MFISDIVRRSGRNLRQSKARTVLTALAIAVGAFTLALTLAATNGAKSYVNGVIADNFDPAELIVSKDAAVFNSGDDSKPQEYNESFGQGVSRAGAPVQVKYLDKSDIDKLKAVDGIQSVRLGIVQSLQYVTRTGQKKYIGNMQVFNPAQKPIYVAGGAPAKPGDVLLPEAFVSTLGFSDSANAIGKTITVAIRKPAAAITQNQFGSPEPPAEPQTAETQFTIVGIAKKQSSAQPGTELYLLAIESDVKGLQEMATVGTKDFQKYLTVFAKVANGKDSKILLAQQEKLKSAGFVVRSVADTQQFLSSILNILQGIVLAFGMIAVVASLFGVINTMYISVLQRYREIGLMKALGMPKKDISRLFRFEAALIGLIGGSAGAFSAFVLGTVLNPIITKQLDLGVGKKLLQFDSLQTVGLVLVLVFVAILAGLFPARKAAKLDPIEALRTE